MDQKEKVTEEKLYKVIRKKGNHQNTKVNEDGSRVALQFTKNNNMDGPLDIIEATDDEVIRQERNCPAKEEPGNRSFGRKLLFQFPKKQRNSY